MVVRSLRFVAPLFVLSAVSCGGEGEVNDSTKVETTQAGLEGEGTYSILGKPALGPSTVLVQSSSSRCTGVIVSRTHVLTAAHCAFTLVAPSDVVVSFYRPNEEVPSGDKATATRVDIRPGLVIVPGSDWAGYNNDDVYDTDGKFADIVVITLDRAAPTYARPARMPLSYPGAGVTGYLVGTGLHWGQANDEAKMKFLRDSTYSDNVSGGHFLINSSNQNPGDSGGPFYTFGVDGYPYVHGVFFGENWEWAYHGTYTSIRYHLGWILDRMSYTGGMITQKEVARSGTLLAMRTEASWRVCALACAQNDQCVAYNHLKTLVANQCRLLSAAAGAPTAQLGATTGIKFAF